MAASVFMSFYIHLMDCLHLILGINKILIEPELIDRLLNSNIIPQRHLLQQSGEYSSSLSLK